MAPQAHSQGSGSVVKARQLVCNGYGPGRSGPVRPSTMLWLLEGVSASTYPLTCDSSK